MLPQLRQLPYAQRASVPVLGSECLITSDGSGFVDRLHHIERRHKILRISDSSQTAGATVEVAPIYVLLASDQSSYVSGSRLGETGGKPIL